MIIFKVGRLNKGVDFFSGFCNDLCVESFRRLCSESIFVCKLCFSKSRITSNQIDSHLRHDAEFPSANLHDKDQSMRHLTDESQSNAGDRCTS